MLQQKHFIQIIFLISTIIIYRKEIAILPSVSDSFQHCLTFNSHPFIVYSFLFSFLIAIPCLFFLNAIAFGKKYFLLETTAFSRIMSHYLWISFRLATLQFFLILALICESKLIYFMLRLSQYNPVNTAITHAPFSSVLTILLMHTTLYLVDVHFILFIKLVQKYGRPFISQSFIARNLYFFLSIAVMGAYYLVFTWTSINRMLIVANDMSATVGNIIRLSVLIDLGFFGEKIALAMFIV